MVVFSHADIPKPVIAAAMGLPLDAMHRFRGDPASISTLVLFGAAVEVAGINHAMAGMAS